MTPLRKYFQCCDPKVKHLVIVTLSLTGRSCPATNNLYCKGFSLLTTSISVLEWPILHTIQPFFMRSRCWRDTTFLLPDRTNHKHTNLQILLITISNSYIAHISTKQGTQGAKYIQTFRKNGYCRDEF